MHATRMLMQEFGWNAGAAGIVQSSFFFGYLLAQLPGGYFASRLGGRRVLPIGLSTWSLGTFIAPLMASSVSTLGISRCAA
jgi:MFS family permease